MSFNLIACKFLQVPSLRLMTIIQQQGFRYIFYLTWVNTLKIKVYVKKSQFFLEPFYPFSTIFPWIVKCLKCFIFNWIISTPNSICVPSPDIWQNVLNMLRGNPCQTCWFLCHKSESRICKWRRNHLKYLLMIKIIRLFF